MVTGCLWQGSCLPGWLAPSRPLKLATLHFLNRRGQHDGGQTLPTLERSGKLEAKLSEVFPGAGRKGSFSW